MEGSEILEMRSSCGMDVWDELESCRNRELGLRRECSVRGIRISELEERLSAKSSELDALRNRYVDLCHAYAELRRAYESYRNRPFFLRLFG